MKATLPEFDPRLDLEFERFVDVPRELLWRGWTTPKYLMQWFTPAPWKTVACEIDLRPGGRFSATMRSPEGQEYPNQGCYLEVIEQERLVWTNGLLPGYRPVPPPTPEVAAGGSFGFTAVVSLTTEGTGTRYRARVMHGSVADCSRHEQMQFHDGWGKALQQLVALIKTTALA